MKLLPETFTENGFVHSLVQRRGYLACYRRAKIGSKARHFETVRIRNRKACVIKDRTIEAHEVYPPSEKWGADGYTFDNEAAAMAKMDAMQIEDSAK